ncbi:AbrB family transcriptional regulator [Variovorax sp. J2P1-59]|uniref:AbrB family transcriptional regulator n=1 Tax=Variovorax flavidus TaxID=3053501 RepID=UPI002578C674|nr:AbrB family transcriptional regulator [Variovorax sp. J2P1-59]MDM0078310.1 AbrB family transcriptional regulator [Variovorax sp. J2P1-59]
MSSRFPIRVLATLLLAFVAASVCVVLHTPLPWMIGPLLAVSIASIAGVPTASHTPLRNAGQWVIGVALGLYFTPQVVSLVASVWWAIALAIAWALVMGWVFGLWLHRLHVERMPHIPVRSMRATTYFSGAIGGASEMTLLAERAGARTDLVAAAHSLRVVLVTILVPFGMQWSGMHGLVINASSTREVHGGGLVLLAMATGIGGLALRATGRTNPWFMGPLLVAMGLTMAGQQVSGIPTWLSNAAQLVIAVSLGARFSREFLQTAPRWMATVAVGTLGLIALCGAFAWGLSRMTGLHPATMILGTSPGGIAEMSITAKVLQLGVPVVTAFQVCRLVAVLLIVGPLYGWLFRRERRGAQ